MAEDLYRLLFEAQARSPSLRDAWRDAYGADYPRDADPLSFVTRTDLRRIVDALALRGGDDLVDIGCGAGGPGAQVAVETGARLTGVDASIGAVALARDRHLGRLPVGSRFEHGDFTATGLADAFAHGAMSTDALLFAPDPAAAFRELARILRPGARLAFTSFELRARSSSLAAGPVPGYRPLLEAAGFCVEVYDEAPDWEARMRAVFAGILARREALRHELGQPAADLTFAWATLRPPELPDSRRIFAVARNG